ncbi:MAG TPA: PEGA domain-containing protein [Chitinispirillaceae bacterium]|jgi:hypothetical protein|nr:PEGA domain-containing protein [Chitinispirillaceae bacterium]
MGRKTLLLRSLVFLVLSAVKNSYSSDAGILSVITEPESIEVWINNDFLGLSPVIDKKMPEGTYQIKLVDPLQRSSVYEQISISKNTRTIVEKKIDSRFGCLKVSSVPQGAKVFLSTELGTTPLVNEFMNPGTYSLRIQHPDTRYDPLSRSITIKQGDTVSLNESLEREKILNKKALIRLSLGAAAAGGFVWAIIEQGLRQKYTDRYKLTADNKYKTDSDIASRCSILGITIGSACLIGLEIAAFF